MIDGYILNKVLDRIKTGGGGGGVAGIVCLIFETVWLI